MTEIAIDLTEGTEDSVTIVISLADPAVGDGIDVWKVERGGEEFFFEADEDCDDIDVIMLAIQTIRQESD